MKPLAALKVRRTKTGTLYLLAFKSGKSYIGITTKEVKSRINNHRKAAESGSSCVIHRAWRKYGKPKLIILKTGLSLSALIKAEKKAIKQFNTLVPNGYNMTTGGDSNPMNNPEIKARLQKKLSSQENKDKISAALKKPGVKEKMDAARIKKHTKETKAKISNALTGIVRSEETCEKISQIMKNKKRSPQTQAKMTAALRTPEMRKHMAIMSGSRKHTEESKAKMSDSQRKRIRDPGTGAKISAGLRAYHKLKVTKGEQKMNCSKRGMLTKEIKAESKRLLGYSISQTELRLMAYVQYVMVNEQRIDIRKVNGKERNILQTWRDKKYIEGGASGLAISKEFWNAICEVVWLGYVIGGSQ